MNTGSPDYDRDVCFGSIARIRPQQQRSSGGVMPMPRARPPRMSAVPFMQAVRPTEGQASQ